jgi:drug/metabolite transporter (DMT)-like permease
LPSRTPSLVFAALCFIWGSTWLGIKVGLEFLPPFLFAGTRFATATIALFVLAKMLHARMPTERTSWIVMVFLGIFQISLPYGLVFWGEQYISSGLSAVLFATMPFFVVIFAHILADEKLTRIKVLGVFLSFVGLVAIFWRDVTTAQILGAQYSLFGSLALVGSAASGGLANVVAKRYAEKIDPATNVLVQHLIGMAALMFLGLAIESRSTLKFTSVAVAAVLYLGIVGSALGFIGLYWLLKKTTATNSSLITFITPILALVLGWVVLQEVPDPNVFAGAALILAGVYATLKPAGRYY